MKKILALALCAAMGPTFTATAQESTATQKAATAQETEAQAELNGYIQDGITKFSSPDGKYTFRVGARVDVDGAYYFDDYTDRGSGANLSAARLRLFSKLGNHFDFKFDVDFMAKGNMLKDVYLRWHSNSNGFFRVGNFAEPFSAENIQSTMDYPFIAKSATVQTLGTGRALGLTYRFYHPWFWFEGGAFSQKLSKEVSPGGDMGYSFSGRLLGRYTSDDLNVHLGGSVNFRRPDAKGFINGSDDYNRSVTLASNLETNIDNTAMLGATVNNVKNIFKYGFELMASYKNVYLKGEYIHARFNRERDWDFNFNNSLGTFMGSMFPTISAYKALMGEDTPANFKGVTVEAGVLLLGGDYSYNRVDALMRRPGGKTLELVARFNHTSLNDIIPGSTWQIGMKSTGGFYDSALHAAFGVANASVAGGRVNSLTVGLNYYVTKTIVTRLDYSYAHLNNPYNLSYRNDKNLSALSARVAFEF